MPLTPPRFTDAFGGRLPALERCLIRYRSLQITLSIFHAEELKRDVIAAAETMAYFRQRVLNLDKLEESGDLPKNRLKRAFATLVKDGLLSVSEKRHMVQLIDLRNAMAHQLHELSADLNPDRFARDHVSLMPKRPKHDYEVVDKLRAARCLLDDRIVEHHYVTSLRYNDVLFSPIDRAITSDLKALDQRIRKLVAKRAADIESLNAELYLADTDLREEFHPRHPFNRHENGRLTGRGVEVCYRLFDLGKSPHAVAHLMGLRITSARLRLRRWQELGGRDRTIETG